MPDAARPGGSAARLRRAGQIVDTTRARADAGAPPTAECTAPSGGRRAATCGTASLALRARRGQASGGGRGGRRVGRLDHTPSPHPAVRRAGGSTSLSASATHRSRRRRARGRPLAHSHWAVREARPRGGGRGGRRGPSPSWQGAASASERCGAARRPRANRPPPPPSLPHPALGVPLGRGGGPATPRWPHGARR